MKFSISKNFQKAATASEARKKIQKKMNELFFFYVLFPWICEEVRF